MKTSNIWWLVGLLVALLSVSTVLTLQALTSSQPSGRSSSASHFQRPASSRPVFVVDSARVQELARELASASNDSLRAYWRTYWQRRQTVLVLPPRIDSFPSQKEDSIPSMEDLMYKSIVVDSMSKVEANRDSLTMDSMRVENSNLQNALNDAIKNPVCKESFFDKAKEAAGFGASFFAGYLFGTILH